MFRKPGQLLILISLLCSYYIVSGQNCSCITLKKDKHKGTKTFSSIQTIEEYHCVLFYKEISIKDTLEKHKYSLLLFVPSTFNFNDTMLKRKEIMHLKLEDNSILNIDSVTLFNNPANLKPSIGFTANLTEEEIKKISINPIITITIIGIVTSMNSKEQKEMEKIINCLLNSK